MLLVKLVGNRVKVIALSLLLIQFLNVSCSAQGTAQELRDVQLTPRQEIDDLSEQILAKEIELEKLNTYFAMYYAKSGKWRAWRQFFWIEANSSATEAGLIESEVVRWGYVRNPYTRRDAKGHRKVKPINRTAVEDGLIPQMVGQFIGALGSTGELTANFLNDRKAHKLGFDPHAFAKKVLKLKSEIDQLLVKRKALVETSTIDESDRQIALAEGNCLVDIRDLALIGYQKAYVRGVKLRTFENVGYVVDTAKNLSGALGNLVGIIGAAQQKPRIGGSASLLTTISGSLIIAIPFSSRLAALVVGKALERKLSRDIDSLRVTKLEGFDQDRDNLRTLLAGSHGSEISTNVFQRMPLYVLEDSILRTRIDARDRELDESNRITQENIVVGTTAGATKVAFGVCGMLAGWKYPHKPIRANKLIAAGTTAYQVGTAEIVAETLRMRFMGERASRRLAKDKLLPGQVLEKHLETLDSMEKTLDSCRVP